MLAWDTDIKAVHMQVTYKKQYNEGSMYQWPL